MAGRKHMKAISRRLCQLEENLGAGPETEFTRRLCEKIEAGRRHLAEARASGEYQVPESGPLFEARRQRLLEAAGFRPASNRGR
jgi:hypothetical protein